MRSLSFLCKPYLCLSPIVLPENISSDEAEESEEEDGVTGSHFPDVKKSESKSGYSSHPSSPCKLGNGAVLESRDDSKFACFPIVDKQFCSSSLVVLTVRKKPLVFSGGGFTVTDSSGQVVFMVDGRGPSFSHRLLLMDAIGKPLLTLQRKVLNIMYNAWDGFAGDKYDRQKPIFSLRKSFIFNRNAVIEVFLSSNKRKEHFDYKIEGCYMERYCTVYSDARTIVAEVKRKYATPEVLLSKDVYNVVVRAGIDQAFIMGLVVILHQMSGENDSI